MKSLNELECVDGQVWANIWTTDTIVRIDPATGEVNTVLDASEVAGAAGRDSQKVLNGIAHIDGDEYLITGKYWPKMYRVRIDAPRNSRRRRSGRVRIRTATRSRRSSTTTAARPANTRIGTNTGR